MVVVIFLFFFSPLFLLGARPLFPIELKRGARGMTAPMGDGGRVLREEKKITGAPEKYIRTPGISSTSRRGASRALCARVGGSSRVGCTRGKRRYANAYPRGTVVTSPPVIRKHC